MTARRSKAASPIDELKRDLVYAYVRSFETSKPSGAPTGTPLSHLKAQVKGQMNATEVQKIVDDLIGKKMIRAELRRGEIVVALPTVGGSQR